MSRADVVLFGLIAAGFVAATLPALAGYRVFVVVGMTIASGVLTWRNGRGRT